MTGLASCGRASARVGLRRKGAVSSSLRRRTRQLARRPWRSRRGRRTRRAPAGTGRRAGSRTRRRRRRPRSAASARRRRPWRPARRAPRTGRPGDAAFSTLTPWWLRPDGPTTTAPTAIPRVRRVGRLRERERLLVQQALGAVRRPAAHSGYHRRKSTRVTTMPSAAPALDLEQAVDAGLNAALRDEHGEQQHDRRDGQRVGRCWSLRT